MHEVDNRVRLHVYDTFVASGRPPGAEETAQALDVSVNDAAASYRRLETARVFVLAPGTVDVWMANPFCSTPTSFRVSTPRGDYWGTCAWDGLGIVASLGGEGTVRTLCPDCNEPMHLRVSDGELQTVDGVAHFLVPARRWWANIAFT